MPEVLEAEVIEIDGKPPQNPRASERSVRGPEGPWLGGGGTFRSWSFGQAGGRSTLGGLLLGFVIGAVLLLFAFLAVAGMAILTVVRTLARMSWAMARVGRRNRGREHWLSR